MKNLTAIRVKANAHYTCQECGSTELIQAHHEIPGDDNTLIALCAECHSKRHPNVPRNLFFNNGIQPYWHNKSASSLAKELGVHPRTIIRTAKKLEILSGELSPLDKELIKNSVPKLQPRAKIIKPKRMRFPMTCNACGYYWLAKVPRPFGCPRCYRDPQLGLYKKKQISEYKKPYLPTKTLYVPITDIASLAHKLNIPWRTVWRWERRNRPSQATVEKMELALSTIACV